MLYSGALSIHGNNSGQIEVEKHREKIQGEGSSINLGTQFLNMSLSKPYSEKYPLCQQPSSECDLVAV